MFENHLIFFTTVPIHSQKRKVKQQLYSRTSDQKRKNVCVCVRECVCVCVCVCVYACVCVCVCV